MILNEFIIYLFHLFAKKQKSQHLRNLPIMEEFAVIGQKLIETKSVNIVDLPDEILLRIIQYSIEDVASYKIIGDTCKRFGNIVSDYTLYKSVKIVDDASVKDAVAILRKYRSTIEKLEISNIGMESLWRVLHVVNELKLENLKYLELEWVRLTVTETYALSDVVLNCSKLRYIMLVNGWIDLPVTQFRIFCVKHTLDRIKQWGYKTEFIPFPYSDDRGFMYSFFIQRI